MILDQSFERLSDFPKATHLLSERARMLSQICWIPKTVPLTSYATITPPTLVHNFCPTHSLLELHHTSAGTLLPHCPIQHLP